MFPHADKKGAQTAVERIRKQFESKKFTFWEQHRYIDRQFRSCRILRDQASRLERTRGPRRYRSLRSKAQWTNRIEFELDSGV